MYKQQIETIIKDKRWVDMLKLFNMEESDNKRKKINNTAIKNFSMSLILNAQIFYTMAGNTAYKVWQEFCKTFDMKDSENLLRLMTRFASYKPKLRLRPRI